MTLAGIRFHEDGTPGHLRALDALERAGCPVPEGWRARGPSPTPLDERRWWVSNDQHPSTLGFLLRVSQSRRVPWAQIARVDQLGGPCVDAFAPEIARLIHDAVTKVGRVMRAEVRVFHREAAARATHARALEAVGFQLASRYTLYRFTHALNIAGDSAAMLKALPSGTRQRIREPQRKGLVLRTTASVRDVPRLLALMDGAFSRTDGRLQRELAQRDLTLAVEAPTYRPLVTLEHAGGSGPERIVAFALGAHNGDHVTYMHGAAERGGGLGTVSLGYAPVWELVRWASEHGATWFDLGGVTTSEDPKHPMAGIAHFKRRFGGTDIEVATELQLTIRPMETRLERLVGSLLPQQPR